MPRKMLIVGFVLLLGVVSSLALASNLASSNANSSAAVRRSWGLEVTAKLSPSRISTSETINLHADIRNLRPLPVVLHELECAEIRPVIWDSKRRLVWQSDYLCGLMQPVPTRTLGPGQTIAGDGCYGVLKESFRCPAIPFRIIQPGTYTIGGMFYDQQLPELKFTIAKDDLFDAFGPGDLMTPLDGQYVRTTTVSPDLLATTHIQNLQLAGADVMVLQVEIKNTSASTIQLPVKTCDFPLAFATHSDSFEGPSRHAHLTDGLFHDVCDSRFRQTTEAISPGQSITTRICFDTRDHQAPFYECIGLYERSTERIGLQIYGFDLPEFTIAVNR
jgi:hypothetical protein